MNTKYQVDIIESERGFGQRLEGTKYFANKKEAEDLIEEFNKVNNEQKVPNWYMHAKLYGIVDLDDKGDKNEKMD